MDPEFDQKSLTRSPSDFSCQALAESLKKNSTLMDLNLLYNQIDDEGVKAWCLVRWEVHRSERREFARSERRLFTRSDRRHVKDCVKRVAVLAKT